MSVILDNSGCLNRSLDWSSGVHELNILSSTTSTELHKITLPVNPPLYGSIFAAGMGMWNLLDKTLCELIDRLVGIGHRHTLEVELRLLTDLFKCDLTSFSHSWTIPLRSGCNDPHLTIILEFSFLIYDSICAHSKMQIS